MSADSRALITGVNGFAGLHLAEYLHTLGVDVHGIDIDRDAQLEYVTYQQVELPDGDLEAVLESAKPSHIYHLAAVSHPKEADISPMRTLKINLMGTISLLDAVKKVSPESKVLLVGSAKEYGNITGSEPLSEDITPSPTSFYGISKFASELTGLSYVEHFGIDIRFTRSFNHTGPGQSQLFVCSDWARQVAYIERKPVKPEVNVGDLSPVLDMGDVRDVVRAYHLILESGSSAEVYNVCSGKGVSLSYILGYLCGKSGKKIEIVKQENRLRPESHNLSVVGSNSKLRNQTGWEPSISIEETLDDLFSYWMGKIFS